LAAVPPALTARGWQVSPPSRQVSRETSGHRASQPRIRTARQNGVVGGGARDGRQPAALGWPGSAPPTAVVPATTTRAWRVTPPVSGFTWSVLTNRVSQPRICAAPTRRWRQPAAVRAGFHPRRRGEQVASGVTDVVYICSPAPTARKEPVTSPALQAPIRRDRPRFAATNRSGAAKACGACWHRDGGVSP
jgi:hypothetical protein